MKEKEQGKIQQVTWFGEAPLAGIVRRSLPKEETHAQTLSDKGNAT